MDKAEIYELDILLTKYNEAHKQDWERTRFISYVVAQTQNKRKLKLTDILQFQWEKPELKENADDIKEKIKMFQKAIENKKDVENEVVTLQNFFGRKKDDETMTQAEKRQRQNEMAKKYNR